MSKNATEEQQQPPPTVKSGSPAYVDELLKNGTAILTAKTRDELAEMVNEIPADVHYGAGAVGFNHETGAFVLRVNIL
jgi:hypothetical protein